MPPELGLRPDAVVKNEAKQLVALDCVEDAAAAAVAVAVATRPKARTENSEAQAMCNAISMYEGLGSYSKAKALRAEQSWRR